MAYTDRAWLWASGDSNTLYVQVNDQTDDQDQVVFKWRNEEPVTATLRSTRDVLTDCQLVSADQAGCKVIVGDRQIDFHWEQPSYKRSGFIAEGVPGTQTSTTWAQRRRKC